jgi:hypothetical protein
MSVPYIAWAFQQRDLTAAQKLVLISLCDRANGERVCFPSFPKIASDCELSLRAVAGAVRHLCDVRRLIAKVTDKQERAAILSQCGARPGTLSNVYRILRPADGANGYDHTPAKSARVPQEDSPTPAKSARPTSAKYARVEAQTPAPDARIPLQNIPKTPAKYAPEPSKEPTTEPLRAQAREEGGRIKNSGKQEGDASPTTPPQPEPSGSDDPADRPADPGHVAAVLAALKRDLRMRAYPPRAAALDRNEQIAEVEDKPRPKTAYLPEHHLRAQRAQYVTAA